MSNLSRFTDAARPVDHEAIAAAIARAHQERSKAIWSYVQAVFGHREPQSATHARREPDGAVAR